jgi:hypothetical protein
VNSSVWPKKPHQVFVQPGFLSDAHGGEERFKSEHKTCSSYKGFLVHLALYLVFETMLLLNCISYSEIPNTISNSSISPKTSTAKQSSSGTTGKHPTVLFTYSGVNPSAFPLVLVRIPTTCGPRTTHARESAWPS